MRRSLLVSALVLGLAAGVARADDAPFVPEGLPHQGRLLDSNDQPVTQQMDLTFSLYRAATGGTPVWTETRHVSVDGGYYSLVLGDPSVDGTTPITTDLLAGPTFLAVTIGGSELSPRLQVGSVPFAHRADLANRMQGGTIEGATITGSSIDATSVKVNGQTVIDSDGNLATLSQQLAGAGVVAHDADNLGGQPASAYATNATLTNSYATSSELAEQEYANRLRNGSFEEGSTGALPAFWTALGGGSGSVQRVSNPRFGQSALEVSDNDNVNTVAVEQVVVDETQIAGYVGATFTVSAFAKKKAGASSTHGRLCVAEGEDPSTWDCADLGTGSDYAAVSKSHVVSAQATELAVVLDSGAEPGDANDYVFDGVMLTRGSLVVPFSPAPAEAFAAGSIDASKISAGPGSGLDADTLDGLDSTAFVKGGYVAGNAAGNVPVSNGTVNANLNADKLDGLDSSAFVRGDFAAGNARGDVPVSNGTLNPGLNADQLDGFEAAQLDQLGATQTITGAKTFSGSLTATGAATFTGSTTLTTGTSGKVELASDLGGLDFGHIWTPAPVVNGTTYTTKASIEIDGTGGDMAIGYNATNGRAAIIADGPFVSTEDGASFAGPVTQGCAPGWTTVNGGRLCVMDNLQGPADFYTALGFCKAHPGGGFNGHVCTFMEAQTACATGLQFYAGSAQRVTNASGWYGDDSLSDDVFPTWNLATCGENNTGTGQSSGNQLYYRCCY